METGEAALERWWSKKYALPPNHPLYLERTRSSLEEEWLMDLMDKRDEIRDQLALQPQNASALRNQLSKIEEVLDEAPATDDDDMFDLWDQQIARGETPDFSRR